MTAAPRRLAASFHAHPGSTGLVPFVTAGYPSLEASLDMLRGFSSLGVRAIEVGIPFSDPIADGPEIQRASEWALRGGVTTGDAIELVRRFREGSETPVVLMTYANPALRNGVERFAADASAAGVDGVIVSDLPPDESPEVWKALDAASLDTIQLVAPTTDPARLPLLLGRCTGFVYCLARTGVTGRSAGFAGSIPERVAELRSRSSLPVAVGFGISSAADARALRGVADAVVVGAAFMRAVTERPDAGAADRVLALAGDLTRALAG
jgi:tryptophan synthase alpha chain